MYHFYTWRKFKLSGLFDVFKCIIFFMYFTIKFIIVHIRVFLIYSTIVLYMSNIFVALTIVRYLSNTHVLDIDILNYTKWTKVFVLLSMFLILCFWYRTIGILWRPFLIPETNQGVCTSLAYCSSRDELVASYRPKVGMSNEIVYSQPSPSPSHTTGHRVDGCHVAFKKEDHHQFSKLGSAYANIDAIRLPKSTIIDLQGCNSLFVSADAVMGDLILQELPSFRSVQHLKVHKHPVRDVKYSYGFDRGLLSCLSDDILHLFCTKGSWTSRLNLWIIYDSYVYPIHDLYAIVICILGMPW